MKLRIRGDSIRMRVTRTELQRMADEGRVDDVIHFAPGNKLTYSLESSASVSEPMAIYEAGRVNIQLPTATVDRWASTEEVSIEGHQPLENGNTLRILVEKDFACLAPREDEDESDMFAHPEAEKGGAC